MEIQSIRLPNLGLVSFEKTMSYVPRYLSLDDVVAVIMVVATVTILWYFGLLWEQQDPHLYKMYEKPQESMVYTGGKKGTKNIAEKLRQIDSDILIFWGSQSGTAERLAHRLSKDIRRRFGKRALAADASDFESPSLSDIPDSKLVIFIVSTFGEGDPSDNLHDLWGWMESSEGKPLRNLRYVALGLGNSNYKYYNAVVDITVKRLSCLGGTLLLPTSKADDANGQTEEHYLDFKNALFKYFRSELEFEEREAVYEASIRVVEDMSLQRIDLHVGEPWRPKLDRKAERTMSHISSLPVVATRELFDHAMGRHCIHMELGLHGHPGLKYKTGDHLGIWPINPGSEVEILLNSMGRRSICNNPISLSSLDSETRLKIPTQTTLEALFSSYLEICAPVSRETIASLVEFAPTPSAKVFLTQLSSDKHANEEFSNSGYRNLGRLLECVAPGEGMWSTLPVSLVIEALPAMQPRYYSISSSSIVHARKISITVVVSDKKTQNDAVIPGLCTNNLLGAQHSFLSRAPVSDARINAHIRKSDFKLPASTTQPVVMVAAGTGIAPFRAFLQERERLSKMGRRIGRTILFFGCRNRKEDFVYEEELQKFCNLPELNFSLVAAFSRPGDGVKVYVQDRVQEHADEICDLVVNKEAAFYICGSAAMARDVSKVVGNEIRSRQGWDEQKLKSFLDQQKRIRRWQQDVWG